MYLFTVKQQQNVTTEGYPINDSRAPVQTGPQKVSNTTANWTFMVNFEGMK